MLNYLLEHVNAVGDRWAAWMTAALLDSAALLALIGLLWLAIRRRVAPQVGYCLFLLVPLRLLCPFEIAVPPSVAQWTPSRMVHSFLDRTDRIAVVDAASRRVVSNGETPLLQDPAPHNGSEFRSPTLTHEAAVTRESHAADAPSQAPPPAVAAAPIRWPATLMLLWLGAVLLLAVRFLWVQLQFRTQLRTATPIDPSRLAVDFWVLCERAGVHRLPRLVESDRVMAPAAWGLVRPAIILPRGVAASLTAAQLRWVLLHELAHIRRRDLLVIVVQRFAAILNFFNPAVWIANRIANRLREFACDDLATLLSEGSGVESGEAFVQILRNEHRAHRKLEGALGIYGLDSRASCLHRVRRMLDTDRPIHTKLGWLSLAGLIVVAAISLPHLRAATEPTNSGPDAAANASPNALPNGKANAAAVPDKTAAKLDADAAKAKDQQTFELKVVGPDGKPLPGITVECRCRPDLTVEQIQSGELVRKTSYGQFIKLNAIGQLVLKLPKDMKALDIFIETPGYAPYWAGWNSDRHVQPIPPTLTAELDAAWSAGGIVVDGDGKPVNGATVHPQIMFKRRTSAVTDLYIGTKLTTDAGGKWMYESVPASTGFVDVSINHPSFMPIQRAVTRAEFEMKPGSAPAAKITLNPGLTVTGKVTDESGKPFAGARIRATFLGYIREATTAEDGTYRLVGCNRTTARIVVSAKGRATDMQELRIEPDMKPVDFQMKPGGAIRIRVVDAQNNPVPRARIFVQWWHGPFQYFEFDDKNDLADEHGVWEWNEAPLDEFKADIWPSGDGMGLTKQSLIPRKEEYVFKLPPPLVISGMVIDAETRKPIKRFQVVPGRIEKVSGPSFMSWARTEGFTATGGQYRIRRTGNYFAHLVRIEADGYRAAVSREIKSDEGNVTIDFELKRAKNVVATVLMPDGAPAAKAKVALGVAGSQIIVSNGDIEYSELDAARPGTDDKGLFSFPPQDQPFQLLITHPAGFAHIKTSPEKMPATIPLIPWARVEGTFRVGAKIGANVPMTINVRGHDVYGDKLPHIFTQYDVTTGPDGRFVFERVIPGGGRIGRRIMLTDNDGAADVTSSCLSGAEFPSGKTMRFDLGGNGRAVVGRLQPPDGFKARIPWNFALVNVEIDRNSPRLKASIDPTSPLNLAIVAEYRDWNAPRFTATVDHDGTFRIDDMPAGDYTLSARFSQRDVGALSDYHFTVPDGEAKPSDPPLDLGVLKLVTN